MHIKRVNRRILMIALALGIMLLTTIALSMGTTAENTFAYKKNQATTGTNACGSGEVANNVGCQNIESQIQGDKNSVAITAQQTFSAVSEDQKCVTKIKQSIINIPVGDLPIRLAYDSIGNRVFVPNVA